MDLSTYNRNNAEQRTQPNNPIPPRSRALCCADSPRRGEYGALATHLRRPDIIAKKPSKMDMQNA